MTRIVIHGCGGAMGRKVAEMAAENEQIEVAAGVDRVLSGTFDFPVYESLADCTEDADVVVDFSSAPAVDALLGACVQKKLPLILCTTGLSDEQAAHVEEASREIPILRSANMSLGINLLLKVVEEMAGVLLSADFDAEVLEMHHRRKLDAPSGTALALADAVNRAVDQAYTECLDRHERRMSRPKEEIGIQSLRGGTIVVEHSVIFAGPDEEVEIRHVAYSRAIVANGALTAAQVLPGRKPGLYDMGDILFPAD